MKKIIKPPPASGGGRQRTQRNTLITPKEKSIRKITDKIVLKGNHIAQFLAYLR
jgi:hypothetical protein